MASRKILSWNRRGDEEGRQQSTTPTGRKTDWTRTDVLALNAESTFTRGYHWTQQAGLRRGLGFAKRERWLYLLEAKRGELASAEPGNKALLRFAPATLLEARQ